MKVVIPTEVTEAMLVSSNVEETPEYAYNSGGTYALGDRVYTGLEGETLIAYESLQNGNLNNTPASSPTWWLEIGNIYSPWDYLNTYLEGEKVQYLHNVYESTAGGNLNKNPVTYSTGVSPWWTNLGATNRWRVFDEKVGVQAVYPGNLVYTLTPGTYTSLAVLNLLGTNLNVTINDPIEGEVFNRDYDLIDDANIVDAFSYCFGEFYVIDNVSITDIPPYSAATTVITIETDDSAYCGEIVVGILQDIGVAEAGAELRIKSYSKVTVDDFGNRVVTPRGYSKQRSYRVLIENYKINSIEKTLASLIDTPIVWVVGEDTVMAPALLVYGYFSDLSMVIPYPTASEMNLKIESLTQ